ncbi:MAG: ATP-binding cassette domain-containing protein [Victivallales bacterium]|nr:ATP-binding cassette domain-containing protein [Victivallales bacterium]
MQNAVQLINLKKSFGDIKAVSGISLNVRSGELFGFLGPNGAGKTTTINMLSGLTRPDSGKIIINGIDCSKNSKKAQYLIGVVPDESNLYPELTGFENLCFCASLYGITKKERISRSRELLNKFGLKEAGDRKFGGYSKGMKRKLTIAAGIIHTPKILFLDEPTTGIDVASSRQIRQLISELHKAGTTIFLTTHYIEEAERLCERIAFIVKGSIATIETVENLIKNAESSNIIQISLFSQFNMLKDKLAFEFPNYKIYSVSDKGIRIESETRISVVPIISFIESLNIDVEEARLIKPSLEEVFVKITGIEPKAMEKEKGGK